MLALFRLLPQIFRSRSTFIEFIVDQRVNPKIVNQQVKQDKQRSRQQNQPLIRAFEKAEDEKCDKGSSMNLDVAESIGDNGSAYGEIAILQVQNYFLGPSQGKAMSKYATAL